MKQSEYYSLFGLDTKESTSILSKTKIEKAFEEAVVVRRFEIELYWKKATYFWTLIAASFAGYIAILGSKDIKEMEYFAFIISCIGFIFTFAWYLVNRGSKFWQENWENHVCMLESHVTGPLYKTVLYRPPDLDFYEKYFTGPLAMSSSKINQWISLFVLVVWVILMILVLPKFNLSASLSYKHISVLVVLFIFCSLMFFRGKTYDGAFHHLMKFRTNSIIEKENNATLLL